MTYKAKDIKYSITFWNCYNSSVNQLLILGNIMTVTTSNQLIHLTIRVPKEESAFTYFQFESNEGLCFYSTLESSMGQGYRDLDIKGHVSLKSEIFHVIEKLQEKFSVEILTEEIIEDQ